MEDDYKVYVVDYEYDGGRWSIKVPAISEEDAAARLNAMQQTATVFGYVKGRVLSSTDLPASPT